MSRLITGRILEPTATEAGPLMQEQRLLTGAACSSFSLTTVAGEDGLVKAAQFCLRDIAVQ
ncbi:MAG: hypothetical protein NT138_02015 [Planctomycetales bacterium]|nr:hypothetical protein [Planctomycetales bacterium]